MLVIPLLEMVLRPLFGAGIHNAPLLVQHLGLVLAMFGALFAERGGHLTSLGAGLPKRLTSLVTALICGLLTYASAEFVMTEIEAGRTLAYGVPIWWIQAAMPLGFLLIGLRFALRTVSSTADSYAGIPIFAVLGGLSLFLFWQEGQPLAAIPLSHYQITVNPSLPALPLFTLAGLLFAQSGAAQRLGALLTACSGGGRMGTALATALLCSFFTAFTGGSGVTILALGGLLLPLLIQAGFPRQQGIGLVTSASALGVLLAPSVPLLMYAIIARVPINAMFLAGLLPALVMVGSLLLLGGFLRNPLPVIAAPENHRVPLDFRDIGRKAKAASWELAAPFVAIGALVSGMATPTESAALTALYALFSQVLVHRELDWPALRKSLADCVQVIGGVMLILGMALALTNYLVDAGIPDAAVEWVQAMIPNKWVFLLALNIFLLLAGALMEIFAAIVVLVPLLLPVALSYGIDPIHFGIIFLANMEMGFLCPPAGMNVYFASAMFVQPVRVVAAAVLPAVGALLLGSILISVLPWLSTWHLR
jgi:tripartite ATP-independent transporter DctM subunit